MNLSKRLFDMILGFIALVLFFPILILTGILIVIFIGRPVLFIQARPGFKGKIFNLYKFRTMKNAFDDQGQPLPDELRMTSFGRFLRRSSLDELPELINVLKGDMSLVGPRPLLVEYLPLYSAEQAKRHDVRPGITGLAQISGRNNLEWVDRFNLDIYYVENQSLKMDINILFRTVFKVLGARDVEKKGHVTATKFEGS